MLAAQLLRCQHRQRALPRSTSTLREPHDDVAALSALPQCSEIRGDPFVEGDPEDKDHEYRDMIGPTRTC